jgi:hypothetical protein
VLIFIDVKEETGKTVMWAFENSNAHALANQGYNRNTLRVGQEVTAIINPAVNGPRWALGGEGDPCRRKV